MVGRFSFPQNRGASGELQILCHRLRVGATASFVRCCWWNGDSSSASYRRKEQGALLAMFFYELSAAFGGPLAFPVPSSARFRKPSLTVGEVPV